MKKLFFMALVFASVSIAGASNLPPAFAYFTLSTNLLSGAASDLTTNATSSTFVVEDMLYHTVQGVSSTTNSTITIQTSLDNTNWVTQGTCTFIATSNATQNVTFVGKFSYLRATLLGTNQTFKIMYLGGR